MQWYWEHFSALDAGTAYRILAARAAVFVVEQHCAYLDPDGLDGDAWHLWASAPDGAIAACLRVLLPGARYAEHSLGRVLTTAPWRGTGLGRDLVARGIEAVAGDWGAVPIRIAAQAHLEAFYGGFGFVACGQPFDEDGIAHLEMLRAP